MEKLQGKGGIQRGGNSTREKGRRDRQGSLLEEDSSGRTLEKRDKGAKKIIKNYMKEIYRGEREERGKENGSITRCRLRPEGKSETEAEKKKGAKAENLGPSKSCEKKN